MLGWFYFTMPSEEQLAEQRRQQAIQDSLAFVQQEQELERDSFEEIPTSQNQPSITDNSPTEKSTVLTGIFATTEENTQTEFTVETDLYHVVFTNKGAGPATFTLKNHKSWAGTPIQLISDTTRSAYNVGFLTTENYNVETQNILFRQVNAGSSLTVNEGDSKELSYILELENGRQLLYTYTFFGDSYEIDLDIRFVGLREFVIGRAVDFGWNTSLRFTEKDRVQEALATSAYFYAGGELEQLKADDFEENNGLKELSVNGNIEWVASKTKFFAQIIQPTTETDGAYLKGQVNGKVDDPLTNHDYTASVTSDIPSDGVISYRLYLGPMKYYDVKSFNDHAFDMVEVGYGWLRWFSDPFVRFIVIPFFTFFSGFIPNYGVLIIIFAASVKLILSPLTIKSYKSMAAMKELQPQMKEIQDKYKDNPQKQQKATMALYKKNKVNPLGGCLPMLLQFPILITLWRFFQNSILLRQEPFLWVSDLSAPDYILDLPFTIPFLGDQIAGLVLLMTASMVLQSKITSNTTAGGSSNPMAQQMKIMQYFLPFMLLFVFNNFASGLSLYYLIFNLLSIVQQVYINKSTHTAAVAKTS
ncbi:MAG: membrane protein insertase YidC [Balneolaceae bacterium]